MKRTLDIQKVDEALKRAARKAVSGPKSARSGRLLVDRIVADGDRKGSDREKRLRDRL
jgi:hypothetical protein